METRFENSFVRDKQAAKQLYEYWYYRQPLFLVVHIIVGLNFLSGIVGIILNAISPDILFINSTEEMLPIMLFILVFEAMLAFSCYSNVNNMAKRDAELSGGQLVCTITVTDDEIIHSIPGSSQTLPLSRIKSVFTTRDYIMIITEARHLFILKKDSFTVGDEAGFMSFLRERGIKISGQKK